MQRISVQELHKLTKTRDAHAKEGMQMEHRPEQPLQLAPADPKLPAVRAAAPVNRAELRRTDGTLPNQAAGAAEA